MKREKDRRREGQAERGRGEEKGGIKREGDIVWGKRGGGGGMEGRGKRDGGKGEERGK